MTGSLMRISIQLLLVCPCALAAEKDHRRWFEDEGQVDDSSPDEMSFDVTNHGRFIRQKNFADAARRDSYDQERAALLERASHVFQQLRHNRDDVIEEPRRKEQPRERPREGHFSHKHRRSHSRSQHRQHSLSTARGRQHNRGKASMSGRSRFSLGSDMDTVDPDAPGAPQDQSDSTPDASPNRSQDQLDELVKQDKAAHIDDDDGAEDGPTEASKEDQVESDPTEASKEDQVESDPTEASKEDQADSGKESVDDSAGTSESSNPESSSDDGKVLTAQALVKDSVAKEDAQTSQESLGSAGSEGVAAEAVANSNLRASKAVVDAALSSPSQVAVSRDKDHAVTSPSMPPHTDKNVDGSKSNQVLKKTHKLTVVKESPKVSQEDVHRFAESLGSLSGELSGTKVPVKATEQSIDIIEKLNSQYNDLASTLQAAKTEEQTLQRELLDAMGERSAGTFVALGVAGLITFALVAVCALPLRSEPHDVEDVSLPQPTWLPKYAGIQAVSLGWTLISTAQYVLMIPDAYGLPYVTYMPDVPQGRGVFMTSLLLILVSSEGARRLMRQWCQTRNRTVVLNLILGQLSMAFLFTVASDISNPWKLGDSLRQIALVISRLGFGICLGLANILFAMAVKVTPPERMMQFTLSRSASMCIGAGIGALFCANLDGFLFTQTLLLVCFPWAILFALSVLTIPEDIAPLLTKLSASGDSSEALKTTGETTHTDGNATILATRKKIWLLVAMLILCRGVLTTAFECTTANILATEFLFSGPQVLLAISSSLMCGVFVMPLLVIVKNIRTSLDIGNVCVTASCCAVFATMILVRHFSQYSAPGLCGMWLLFSVNAASLPALNLVSGIMEAVALQQSLALQQILGDTVFSPENLIMLRFVLQDCLCRFAVPSAGLSLLVHGGQALCAVALFILATIVCISIFCAKDILQSISCSTVTDVSLLKAAAISSDRSIEGAA